jgi:hypothetical protein
VSPPPPEAARLLDPERIQAFEEGLSPLLAHACDGPVTSVLTAELAPVYLTLLDALVLMRRDHELEPLHDEVYRRVARVLGADVPYGMEAFARDIDQLREWGCVERQEEITKIRGYKDKRRERYRYRLTDDAVALVEWLEERLAEKLEGRSADGRDRLTDVIRYLREAVTCLDEWRSSETPSADTARRAIYVMGAVDDAIDAIGNELLTFRAGMLAFTSRPYQIVTLREVLRWLERHVNDYLAIARGAAGQD